MRVLITGGSGFLGHATITALQQAHPDWTIFNLDINPPPASQKDIPYIHADITVLSFVETAMQSCNPDAIIHTAGYIPTGSDRYSTNPVILEKVFLINHTGTLNILHAARSTNCKALVYTSSCTVITDDLQNDYPNMLETLPLGHATLPYGRSKTPAENAVLAANSPDLRTCALRPSTIIGPGDRVGVIPTLHTCIAKLETPWIIGTGDNLYDFVYISNAADAHILALENLVSPDPTAAGEAFFVSNHQPVYFRDFMVAVWREFGHVAPFTCRVPKKLAWWVGCVAEGVAWVFGKEANLSRGSVGDAVGIRYACPEKARRVLGYVPKVDFVEGVRLACEDWKRVLRERERGVGKGE